MQKAKLLALAALAMCAFGAYAAATTYAADANSPSVLVLEKEKATELKGTLTSATGATPELVDRSGEKSITATKAEAKLEKCLEISGHPEDTNLCDLVPIDFTGVKQKLAACRSENNKGEKDPVETVLALLDLHLAAEEELPGADTLQPLLLALALGTADEEEVKFVCGLVKIQVKGVFACLLLPGLANVPTTTKVEVLCKVNAAHELEVGHCMVLCEPWGTTHKIGVEADLNGETLKPAWELLHLEGTLNKDIFIDD